MIKGIGLDMIDLDRVAAAVQKKQPLCGTDLNNN